MRLFILSTIGSRITEARNAKGWSQDDLAAAVGTSQQNIARMEANVTRTSKYFDPICEALGVSRAWLLKGERKVEEGEQLTDPEFYVHAATEALDQAIKSYKSIRIQNGKGYENVDFDLLRRAFEISIKGKLTGDYVTASLSINNLKKA
ncbi:helix-turn-helix transcriptional regulator [Alteromonas pelagimontana]|uniref:Helix-turn-helix transcriptional regulator n=1 Tax=Alteromonas pelagimontana TaxID=1858656 RepID=A0A6M4MA00_9ALTE|nr:helix-turn-helix transcriptional regulator [Alteromonas pelagimontana]QJR79638.1 helix-turn-helix transcriptional regulator [Alteromonas pelagimontana]